MPNLFALYLSYTTLIISFIYGDLAKSDDAIIKSLNIDKSLISNDNGNLSIEVLSSLSGDKPSGTIWKILDTYRDVNAIPSDQKDPNHLIFDKNRSKLLKYENGKEKAIKIGGDKSIEFIDNVSQGTGIAVSDNTGGWVNSPEFLVFDMAPANDSPPPIAARSAAPMSGEPISEPEKPAPEPVASVITKTETETETETTTKTDTKTTTETDMKTTTETDMKTTTKTDMKTTTVLATSTLEIIHPPRTEVITTTVVTTSISEITPPPKIEISTVLITPICVTPICSCGSSHNPSLELPCQPNTPDPFHIGGNQL